MIQASTTNNQPATPDAQRWVYCFDELDLVEARVGNDWDAVRGLLGGKGANLAEMTRLGIPVPPGFTITTQACIAYLEGGERLPDGLWEQVLEALHRVEAKMGRRFGDPENPLLVSCRSGAKFSMPGMMDTVLNIGLNDTTMLAMARLTNDERFAHDIYRRLLQMFGNVVLGIPDERFEAVIDDARRKAGVRYDSELQASDWKPVIEAFKAIIRQETGRDFPQDPFEQLRLAIEAVFKSWNGKRAVDYRNATGIPHTLGTAVNVQSMVFGNLGEDSGTGVVFSRNPATGENELYGDYLNNAQGEDVVAGIRTVKPIATLAHEMPAIYEQLYEIAKRLERHFRDVQDIEFTIEKGKLWILQTRDGKRTARAAIRFAVDFVNEGLIEPREAVLRVSPQQVERFLHPRFEQHVRQKAIKAGRLLAKGVNASPGAAVGMAAFDADTAEAWGKAGKPVIMVRPETKPDDVHGMIASKGILTALGGNSSHAAIVARQFGIPAVVGCHELQIDTEKRLFRVGAIEVREGDWLSIDGSTGEVFLGQLPTVMPDLHDPYLTTLLGWADEFRTLGVWANADLPKDAQRARDFGAEGIGLARTEHMFLGEDRLPIVQRMILAETDEERAAALAELLPIQRADFEGLFRVMDGLPVIIRLIDPPLHEFLPRYETLLVEIERLRLTDPTSPALREKERLLHAVERLREANPMLGLRGVRLGIVFPDVMKMQVRAMFEAACACALEGVQVRLEVMIPLVAHVNELRRMRDILETEAQAVMNEKGVRIPYAFGTMIEVPRAALTADAIAEVAEFFSFGTNDLTQMTYGLSRDDAEGAFLLDYLEQGILPANPFQTLDVEGVGQLMRLAVEKGRTTRPDLSVGICGEHGGDPASIAFCHAIGLNYVSCSPYRVPVARLAAAHAALKQA
ncbi:pyruvate, orthophosphate dikinase [Ardenticatena maritima]|uniref:Pyruvate, phosphate dikinase n=1 Tax=Ardenticatena maritima TaxID=872965 RepID=A0A0M9UDL9_9CHLR|nr:pyruvate, phosphate dikinase [Ardenticatena maritima]GAP64120.1 pyruvate, orthophosphate dikinase [Ardenticatena maritima]